MGERTVRKNGSAPEPADTAESSGTGATVEILKDSIATATSETAGTVTGTAEKRKHNRKNREIPVLITPVESVPPPEPEKPARKARAAKADPVITTAIIAIAGSGMMTAGKLLGDEKLWTPTTAELTGVAEPAARIIERLNASAAVSKYADYIALGVAVATMILPRLLMTSAKKAKGGTESHAAKKGNTTSPYPTTDTKTSPVSDAGNTTGEKVLEINSANVPSDIGLSEINLGYDESF